MSDMAYRFPDRRDFESKQDYLAAKEIHVDFWISRLKLEQALECKFGHEVDAVKRQAMDNRLIHLRRLRQLIRSRKRRPALPRVDARGRDAPLQARAAGGSKGRTAKKAGRFERRCAECGRQLSPAKRSDALYCSRRCKNKRSKRRLKARAA